MHSCLQAEVFSALRSPAQGDELQLLSKLHKVCYCDTEMGSETAGWLTSALQGCALLLSFPMWGLSDLTVVRIAWAWTAARPRI